MKILVTGCAGFIGMHVAKILLKRGDDVFGVDSISDYYDTHLKLSRVARLQEYSNFNFSKIDIADRDSLAQIFSVVNPVRVINLAAQPGVRYSIENPYAYIQTNLVGFSNVIEACRLHKVEHLVYASSSSIYGANTKMPFSELDGVNHPVSLYAASKKANELIAHSYSHLYDLPTTGLRYFSVYGPWGRPDMAPWLFTKAILEGRPIDVFNGGDMSRDFTYVDDIAEATVRVLDTPPEGAPNFDRANPRPNESYAKYKIYNVGNCHPVKLMDFIGLLEDSLGMKAKKNFLPLQQGDVISTYADVSQLEEDFGVIPKVDLATGIKRWSEWYLRYFDIK